MIDIFPEKQKNAEELIFQQSPQNSTSLLSLNFKDECCKREFFYAQNYDVI